MSEKDEGIWYGHRYRVSNVFVSLAIARSGIEGERILLAICCNISLSSSLCHRLASVIIKGLGILKGLCYGNSFTTVILTPPQTVSEREQAMTG